MPFRYAALAAALVAVPVSAQSLPDWGEPMAPSTPETPMTQESQMMGPPSPGGPGGTPPSRVPVDGGLALLALAGAGYAARKLRQP